MSTMKIKKGDTVKVIAGKDKDKEGKVVAVDKKNGKVTVEKVNIITKHTKPSAANQNGGIIQKEAPIDVSSQWESNPYRLQGRGRQKGSCCKVHRRSNR